MRRVLASCGLLPAPGAHFVVELGNFRSRDAPSRVHWDEIRIRAWGVKVLLVIQGDPVVYVIRAHDVPYLV